MFSRGKAGKANLILLFCDQQPSFQKRTEKSEIFKAMATTENKL